MADSTVPEELDLYTLIKQQFTRQEAIVLSEATTGHLAYLERIGLVVPIKYDDSAKPFLSFYTWEQIIMIRLLYSLKGQIPADRMGGVVDFVRDVVFGDHLYEDRFAVINGRLYLCRSDWGDLPELMQVASDRTISDFQGQFTVVILPSIRSIVEEILRTAGQIYNLNADALEDKVSEYARKYMPNSKQDNGNRRLHT